MAETRTTETPANESSTSEVKVLDPKIIKKVLRIMAYPPEMRVLAYRDLALLPTQQQQPNEAEEDEQRRARVPGLGRLPNPQEEKRRQARFEKLRNDPNRKQGNWGTGEPSTSAAACINAPASSSGAEEKVEAEAEARPCCSSPHHRTLKESHSCMGNYYLRRKTELEASRHDHASTYGTRDSILNPADEVSVQSRISVGAGPGFSSELIRRPKLVRQVPFTPSMAQIREQLFGRRLPSDLLAEPELSLSGESGETIAKLRALEYKVGNPKLDQGIRSISKGSDESEDSSLKKEENEEKEAAGSNDNSGIESGEGEAVEETNSTHAESGSENDDESSGSTPSPRSSTSSSFSEWVVCSR